MLCSRTHAVNEHTRKKPSRRIEDTHLDSLFDLLLVSAILLSDLLRVLDSERLRSGSDCHFLFPLRAKKLGGAECTETCTYNL